MWTLHARGAWPALTRLYRNVDCAGGTIRGADRTASRGLLLTTILYVVLFWTLGERVRHPWLRTLMFWLPAAFIPFLFLIPWGWGFGALLYLSVSLIVAALSSYGGCEMVALPSLLFRRQCTVYCPLNVIDLVERRYTQR